MTKIFLSSHSLITILMAKVMTYSEFILDLLELRYFYEFLRIANVINAKIQDWLLINSAQNLKKK